MRILLTGGTGLIGRALLTCLSSDDEVWALARRAHGDPVNGVRYIECDLAKDGWPAAMPKHADVVLHLAQSNLYRDFPSSASDIFAVNVAATARLLDWSRQHGVRHFVLASSGNADRANSYYLACKRAAELLSASYREFFSVLALRFFFVYGPRQRPWMLVPRLAETIRSGGVVSLDGADGIRVNPVFVNDAAQAVLKASQSDLSGIVDVAGPEVLTLRSIAESIGRAVGRTPVFEQRGGAAVDIVGDTAEMSRMLLPPSVRFDEGIRNALVATFHA